MRAEVSIRNQTKPPLAMNLFDAIDLGILETLSTQFSTQFRRTQIYSQFPPKT